MKSLLTGLVKHEKAIAGILGGSFATVSFFFCFISHIDYERISEGHNVILDIMSLALSFILICYSMRREKI